MLDWYLDKWPSWKALASSTQTVRYLNVGGGMGVNYLQPEQFDWPRLCRHLGERLEHDRQASIVRFEPGRFVTAFCGYYLMQVLDRKHSHAGISRFAGTARKWTVVGQLCTPKDVLARDALLPDPEVGDLLILLLTGAYGYNISHADFLCHPRPLQVFIDTGPSNRIQEDFDYLVRDAGAELFGATGNPLAEFFRPTRRARHSAQPIRIRKTCCYYYQATAPRCQQAMELGQLARDLQQQKHRLRSKLSTAAPGSQAGPSAHLQ